jgi:hypothetical protein
MPPSNNGMHPTLDTAALSFSRGLGGRVMRGVKFFPASKEGFEVADGDGEFAVVGVLFVVGAGPPGAGGAEFEFVGAGGGQVVGDFRPQFEPAVAEEGEGRERAAVEA